MLVLDLALDAGCITGCLASGAAPPGLRRPGTRLPNHMEWHAHDPHSAAIALAPDRRSRVSFSPQKVERPPGGRSGRADRLSPARLPSCRPHPGASPPRRGPPATAVYGTDRRPQPPAAHTEV